MDTDGPARTVGRFLFAWVVVVVVSPLWFYPDATGIVQAIGFFLTPLGALALVFHGFETKRLGLFCLAYWIVVFPVVIVASLVWSAIVRIAVPTSLATPFVRLITATYVPLAIVYAIAYWLVYRGGFARLRHRWS